MADVSPQGVEESSRTSDWDYPLLGSVILSAPCIFVTATLELEERLDEIACLSLQDTADADHFLSCPPNSAWNSLLIRSSVNLGMMIGRKKCCRHILYVLSQRPTAAAEKQLNDVSFQPTPLSPHNPTAKVVPVQHRF